MNTARCALQALILLGFVFLASCASQGSSSTEAMLAAAGFRIKTPETTGERQLFEQLPSYKLQRGTFDGKIFYAYKDEREGVAYVGGEKEYQEYQQYAIRRRIARDQRTAAEMQRDLAYGWYGAYGRHYRRFY